MKKGEKEANMRFEEKRGAYTRGRGPFLPLFTSKYYCKHRYIYNQFQ
jgi:hypothetical protein